MPRPNRYAEYIGQVFGELTIVELLPAVGKYPAYKTLCSCGKITIPKCTSVLSGLSRSCGHLKNDGNQKFHGRYAENSHKGLPVDLTGYVFDRITVVSRAEDYILPSSGQARSRWNCFCSCGQNFTTHRNGLISGKTKSCGCFRQEQLKNNTKNRKNGTENFWRDYYNSYKKGATKRNYEFALNFELFKNISSKNCHYCNAFPKENRRIANSYKFNCNKNNTVFDQAFFDEKTVCVNGIDRVDNNKGYVEENVVPCCSTCNRAKYSMSVDEFDNWATRFIDNYKKVK